MRKTLVMMMLMVALATGALAQTAARYRADLAGAGIGKSIWKYKIVDGEAQGEFGVEAEDLRPLTAYKIVTAGRVFWVKTDTFGFFELDVRYLSNFPNIVDGTVITVRNTAGVVVLRGVYRRVA